MNSALEIATSASWKVTYRPWRTTLAPILTSLLRNVVSGHCFTSAGNAKAAKRFLAAALKRSRDWTPRVINTDQNPAYGEAIAELKKEGRLPQDTQHRQVKYLNNRLEGDHGKLKRLIRPTLGFQSMKTAYATSRASR